MKVLIIEDDQGLRQGIAFSLAQEGYEVLQAQNGKEGYRLFLQEAPQGILLDLNLPDMDGNDLCRKIRESSQVPILMLTARDMETDEIMGLSSGADDYMTKPFSVAVLKLRLEKLLGRKGEKTKSHILSSGDIVMDTDLIKVWKAQQEMECSVTEFKILKYFLENKNQVLTQNQILEAVWDREGKFVNPNTLQVNIGRLRKKIEEDPSRPRFIKTIHGIGYIWEERL
ncbi:MAG TPA: response regulator transcription factor [Candidatus Blautia pullistercoris]|uniref:Stage 0 sporulation protein A homolog n=1 Tax=Candidatus Blautia pullistercoris TaxID=2838499 RepID=A0A9D1VN08_9FIRM|nr:response regulator transcription factor [Clostridiales bacterium]HIX38386.1 response regulator transcription factor [Candidatus Blautia pullistercoris]